MGVSTDGILAFGFDIGVEDSDEPEWMKKFKLEDEDSFDFDEWLIKDTDNWYRGMPDAEAKALWAERYRLKAVCPIQFVIHCSYDYAMYILAIRGTYQSANRGSPLDANVERPAQEKIDAAKVFCEQHGIPWQEPRWVLASLWG